VRAVRRRPNQFGLSSGGHLLETEGLQTGLEGLADPFPISYDPTVLSFRYDVSNSAEILIMAKNQSITPAKNQ